MYPRSTSHSPASHKAPIPSSPRRHPPTPIPILEAPRRAAAFLAATLWIGLLFHYQAGAAVITESRTETRVGPVSSGSFEFPRFDPALGTLEGVTIAIEPGCRIDASATAANEGEIAELATANLSATLRLPSVPLSNPLMGSTSFMVSPGSTAASWFTAFGSGGSQSFTDEGALSRWTGLGSESVTWEVSDLFPSSQSPTARVVIQVESTFIRVTVSFYYTPPAEANPLRFDPSDGTFHFVEGEKPVIIEWRADLFDSEAWSLRYESTTNAPGTVIKFPLEGATGFYRARLRDPEPGQRASLLFPPDSVSP